MKPEQTQREKKPMAKSRKLTDTPRNREALSDNQLIAWDYREAARQTCFSVSTLQKLVSREEVPHVKIGHLVRFIPEDLKAWIKEHRRPRRVS
jgi:excisionase family DNA binding protein